MAIRYYIMPAVGLGTRADPRRPKYLSSFSGPVNCMDYGQEAIFLVRGDAIDHAALAANVDVVSPPADLTRTVGSAAAQANVALEAFNIPGDWITSGMTWKSVLKYVGIMFQLAQRYAGLNLAEKLINSNSLDQTFGSLPAAKRTKFQNMAESFGFDASGLSGASTLRQCIKTIADQWSQNLLIGGDSL